MNNDDLISRSALKKKAETVTLWNGDVRRFVSYETIDNAPPIETTIENLIITLSVEELKATTWFKVDTPSGESVSFRREKTGHWINDSEDYGYVECPFCHELTNCNGNKEELHYCWNCGANMRGENHETDN